jgi:hypothetical protein
LSSDPVRTTSSGLGETRVAVIEREAVHFSDAVLASYAHRLWGASGGALPALRRRTLGPEYENLLHTRSRVLKDKVPAYILALRRCSQSGHLLGWSASVCSPTGSECGVALGTSVPSSEAWRFGFQAVCRNPHSRVSRSMPMVVVAR